MAAAKSLQESARTLMHEVVQTYDQQYGLGRMSCAAYDTAWVAMVTKNIAGQQKWLFPECFQYLLDTQSEDGGWMSGMAAGVDGILNTAGPLLALKRHAKEPLQLPHQPTFLKCRIEKAATALQCQLAAWDVSTTDHVGFEIIVPAMLDLLEREDPTWHFEFQAKPLLMHIHHIKMSRFRPEYLYGSQRLTALHSLEAFIGKVDFDKVSHHKVLGSMLGSPSSTAAYLMNVSKWDAESEAYLQHVITYAAGKNSGGVPSAFPSTHFELSWMLSTLLRGGFSPSDMASDDLTKIADILQHAYQNEGGVVGFAPYFAEDVDDTAKTNLTLSMLGRPEDPCRMIEVFETENHFRTYAGERDPSFTANCNALLALLHQPRVSHFGPQIHKLAKFLCEYWWNSDGKIKDKWNTCNLYPSVLFVEAMIDLQAKIDNGELDGTLDHEMQSRIAITLFQACLRPMLDQDTDGSWNQSIEETAYGLLILAEARRLAFFEDLQDPLARAIGAASLFLNTSDMQPSYVWIEKVTYASPVLTRSYLLAALKAASSPVGSLVGSPFWNIAKPKAGMDKHIELFHQAPLFQSLPQWEIRASMVEAALFLPSLRTRRTDVFPRKGLETDDKYFDVIPFFWTSSNNRTRTYASTALLFDMTTIAMLNFQMDEFMEATAGPAFQGRMDVLRKMICNLLSGNDLLETNNGLLNGKKAAESMPKTNGKSHINGHYRPSLHPEDESKSRKTGINGSDPSSATVDDQPDEVHEEISDHISRFLRHILEHPAIKASSPWDKKLLRWELRTYLLAHVQQAEDGTRFEQRRDSGTDTSSVSKNTFFNWVRTTSADHISCPYSFHFVSCLLGASLTIGGGGRDCFTSAGEKYLANDVCRHLSTMCRMYNDLGSADRDLDEGNLNSIEFPEFASHDAVVNKMRELLILGEYERDCMLSAFEKLERQSLATAQEQKDPEALRLAKRRMQVWQMFCDEVDLYGQVYVVKDISARIEG